MNIHFNKHILRNDTHFDYLPLKVQAEINKHFGIVFSLPVEKRGDYLKQLGAWGG